jgi:hypothetical protein
VHGLRLGQCDAAEKLLPLEMIYFLHVAAHHARRAPLLQGPGSAAAVAPLAAPDTMPTTGTELMKLPPVKGGVLPRGLILR